jgi:DNA-binding NarL/FixJ family response regulator
MSERTSKKLDEVLKKLDILVVVQLANSGLTRKEIAEVLKVSEKTIERMLPFAKLGQKRGKK